MEKRFVWVDGTLTANGAPVRGKLGGREYYVVPVTMIRQGVLSGSRGPLLYLHEDMGRDPASWNGVPIVVWHPLGVNEDGEQVEVSARVPDVLNSQGIGYIFSAEANPELTASAWFDIERTKEYDRKAIATGEYTQEDALAPRLERGLPIEGSTGLFTDEEEAEEGATWEGMSYSAIARNYRPDHFAVLPNERGACSIKDGCGVNVLNVFNGPDALDEDDEYLTELCGGKNGKPGPCPTGKSSSGGKGGTGGGKTRKPADVKVKAAQAKVDKINARINIAKKKLTDLKGELKAAKADLSSVKSSVKAQVKQAGSGIKGATKGDIEAKKSAAGILSIRDEHVAKALPIGSGTKQGTVDMEGIKKDVAKAMGKSSPHKVAKEMGITRKFKSAGDARKAVEQKVIGAVGAAVRPVA